MIKEIELRFLCPPPPFLAELNCISQMNYNSYPIFYIPYTTAVDECSKKEVYLEFHK